MRHFIVVVVLIAIVTAGIGYLLSPEIILPTLASEEGAYVDQLFSMYAFVTAFFFALIVVIMIYSAVVFRRKKGDDEPGANVHGNSALEVVWTVIPLGIVLFFTGIGAVYLNNTLESEADEMVVNVTAAQWSWRFDYPEYGVSSSELTPPKGSTGTFSVRVTGCDPFLLGSRISPQTGRRTRYHHHLAAQAHTSRQLYGAMCRAVRTRS